MKPGGQKGLQDFQSFRWWGLGLWSLTVGRWEIQFPPASPFASPAGAVWIAWPGLGRGVWHIRLPLNKRGCLRTFESLSLIDHMPWLNTLRLRQGNDLSFNQSLSQFLIAISVEISVINFTHFHFFWDSLEGRYFFVVPKSLDLAAVIQSGIYWCDPWDVPSLNPNHNLKPYTYPNPEAVGGV